MIKFIKAINQKWIQQLKVTAKVAEELNQSNENSDTQKENIQHITANFRESLKKWESQVMHG